MAAATTLLWDSFGPVVSRSTFSRFAMKPRHCHGLGYRQDSCRVKQAKRGVMAQLQKAEAVLEPRHRIYVDSASGGEARSNIVAASKRRLVSTSPSSKENASLQSGSDW